MFNEALARDDYRCMITGLLDENSVSHCVELQAIAARDRTCSVTIQTCHILSESTTQDVDPMGISEDSAAAKKVRFHQQVPSPPLHSTVIQTHYASGTIAILKSFGFSDFTEVFNQSGGVHEVWNLLSLQTDLHAMFDQLDLWFESTDEVGCSESC